MTDDIQDKTTNLTDNILVSDGEDVIVIAEDGAPPFGGPISEEAIEELTPATIPAPEPVIEDQVIVGTGRDDTLAGGEGDDTIRAGGGDDLIFGNGGDDNVRAGRGADTVFGGSGDDTLRGEDGDDVIEGGEGADTIEGGNGRDTVSYATSSAGVQVALNIGSAAQSGGDAEGDVLRNIENVTGSDYDDTITGNNATNVLRGGDGDDVIDGRGGADTIEGGAGDDVIVAVNASGRTFDGGSGEDTLRIISNDSLRDDELRSIEHLEIQAVAGRNAVVRLDESQIEALDSITFNSVNGRALTVEVFGENGPTANLTRLDLTGLEDGRDTVVFRGDGGQDIFTGSVLGDRIFGNRGNDRLVGAGGDDTIEGGTGGDEIQGGTGDDLLRGQDGNDVIAGGRGADTIEGGNGRDTASYSNSSAGVQVALNTGSAAQSGGDAEGDVLRNIENVTGSDFADAITGNNAANLLRGLAGDDVLDGRGGADTIEGGSGDDVIVAVNASGRVFDGGSGEDTLRIISNDSLLDDTVRGIEHIELEAAAGRNAVVRLSGDQAAALETLTFIPQNGRSATVEFVARDSVVVDASGIALSGFDAADSFRFLGDADAEAFTGTAFGDVIESGGGDDTLNGGDGADALRAGAGDDVLIGGGGADTLNGGAGVDRVDFSASAEGVDIVLNDSARRGDGGDAAGDRLVSIEDATGSAFADAIRGSNAANKLDGGAGDDTLDGLGGADRLEGRDGDDVIDGGAGRDLIDGGAGDDVLTGGRDADTFRFITQEGFGDDVIRDFQRGETIELLREDGVDGFADLEIEQVGGDTVITLDRGSITLEGVDFALDQSSFDFFG